MRYYIRFAYRFSLILILAVAFLQARAQKIKIEVGECQFKIEADMSRNDAEAKAIELAKVDAIRKAFGEYVEQESNITVQTQKVNFRSYGQIKVKGEWIRTIGMPEFKYSQSQSTGFQDTWITCRLKGEVREISSKASLILNTLNNSDKTSIADEFYNKQAIFIYLKSPIEGYLNIFLDDGENVFRLFPYLKMKTGQNIIIEADKDYILFSKDHKYFNTPSDNLILTTTEEYETNTIIAIFSENEFIKPLLSNEHIDTNNLIIPKSISRTEFDKWLSGNRAALADIVELKKQILIKSN